MTYFLALTACCDDAQVEDDECLLQRLGQTTVKYDDDVVETDTIEVHSMKRPAAAAAAAEGRRQLMTSRLAAASTRSGSVRR
jgi:hypothetical protein